MKIDKANLPMKDALEHLVNKTAQPFYKERLRAEKQDKVSYGRVSGYRWGAYYDRKHDVTVKDLVHKILDEAIKEAGSNERYTFSFRQLFYVVRRMYNNYDKSYKRPELEWSNYEKIIDEIEVSRGKRIALREASGEMISPHNTPGCMLGTVEVANYVVPKHKYNKILYIEKRGFLDNIVTDDFHNKFDMAVCAGPGFSTWAVRDLCAKIQADIPITILVAHDCDIAGMNIARTFSSSSPFNSYHLNIVDLGLTPSQVIKDDLEIETYLYKFAFPEDLQNSLSSEDVAWLKGDKQSKPFENARRCELNVFTPAQFLEWLESRLDELGIKAKVR
jgi:hypothetical protein